MKIIQKSRNWIFLLLSSMFLCLAFCDTANAQSIDISGEVFDSDAGANDAADALNDSWEAAVSGTCSGTYTTAYGTIGAPTSGVGGNITDFLLPNGTTYTGTVSYALVNITNPADPSTYSVNGSQGSVAPSTIAGGLQDDAPVPTSLDGENWYSEVAGSSASLNGMRFCFSTPVENFGAFFGDLETGASVDAQIVLLDAGDAIISSQTIGTTTANTGDCGNCGTGGASSTNNNFEGCGNQGTRWIGFRDFTATPVSCMVIIVGDDDNFAGCDSGTCNNCTTDDGGTEHLSFIGASMGGQCTEAPAAGCVSQCGVCEGEDIIVANTGGTIGAAGYNTIYYLVNESATTVVQAIDTDGPATFSGAAVGCYQVHVLNYDEANPPTVAADLTTITDIATITDGCFNDDFLTEYGCACVNPSEEKCEGDSVMVKSVSPTPGNNQLYILTDGAGNILNTIMDPDITNPTDVDFAPLTAGDYKIYALNYPPSDPPSFLPLGAMMPDMATVNAATGCFNSEDFLSDFLCFTVNPLPTVTNVNLATCDDGDGIVSFTLTDAEDATAASNLASGTGEDVDNGATDVTVSYYASQTNADAAMSPLANNYSATNGTVVFVRVENASGCYVTGQVTLNVLPQPMVDLGMDIVQCQGDGSITLDAGMGAGTGSTYLWSPTGETTQMITIADTEMNQTTYSVVITNAEGCVANGMIDVTINPLPVVDLGTNSIVQCQGDGSITLDAGFALGHTYLWSPGGETTQSITIPDTEMALTTYSVTVTNSDNCSNSDMVDVTINPLPIVNAGNDVVQCQGNGTVTLDAGAGFASYSWSPGGETTQTITIPDAASDQTYTVTVTDANGCSSSDMVDVTINALPEFTATANDPITCGGSDGSISMTFSDVEPGIYTINYDGGSFTNVLITGTANITGLAAGIYNNLVITNENGCTSIIDVDVTLIDPNTPDPIIATGATYCDGETIAPITVTAEPGAIIEWFSDAALSTPATGISGGNDQTWTPSNTIGTQTVFVIQTLNGCSSTPTQVDVIVNENPVVNLGDNIEQCVGSGAVLLDAGAGFASYSWSPTGETTQTINVTDAAGSQTYTVTVSNADGCTASDMVDVTINALPTVDPGTYGPICDTDPATTLTGSPADAGGTWSGTGITDNGDGTASFDPEGLTASSPITLTYDYVDANGCANSATTMVVVENCFAPSIAIDKDDSTPGDADTDGDDTQTVPNGGDAVFTITVTNTGDEPLCSLTLLDTATDMGLDVTTCQPSFESIDTDNGAVAAGAGDGILGVGESETFVCTVNGITENLTNNISVNAIGCLTNEVVTDEDDTEVVGLAFDLALIKTTSSFVDNDASGGLSPGDNVVFGINIFNQGDIDAYDINVVDNFVVGELIYVASSLSASSATSPVVTDNGGDGFEVDYLAAGTQTQVMVEFIIDPSFTGTTIMNTAEIIEAATEPDGPNAPDEDNTIGAGPDTNEGNDEFEDDSTGGTDDPEDNDSFDPEMLELGCAICPSTVAIERVCQGNMLYVVDGTNPINPIPNTVGLIYNWYLQDASGNWQLVATVNESAYYSPQVSGTYSVAVSVGDACPCLAVGELVYQVDEVIDCTDCD